MIKSYINVFSFNFRKERAIIPSKREESMGVHINATRENKKGTRIFKNDVSSFVGIKKIKIPTKRLLAYKITIDQDVHKTFNPFIITIV